MQGLDTERIERRAWRLLRKYGVAVPPVPVKEIAEKAGISVRYQPFRGESDISAVLKKDAGKAVIGVNSAHSATRQRFSIAHELGHYYLHEHEPLFVDFATTLGRQSVRFRDGTSSQGINIEEVEANKFAAALLMPAPMVRQAVDRLLGDEPDILPEIATNKLATLFHVSKSAMEFRLLNLELLIKLDD
jgi:Zn-dependent peptidase ImmA (M78 family)